MAILKGAKDAEVIKDSEIPPEKAKGFMAIQVPTKDKGRKKSSARKTAEKAAQENVKERSRQQARNNSNKSKQPNPLRFARNVHRSVTGTNSAFSSANPNLIFVGTLGLIVASGISSHRIQNIFHDALNPSDALATNPRRLFNNLKIIGVQLIFAFGITLISRLSPGASNFFLVVIIGIWILWIMRNPEIFILLNSISQDETSSPKTNNSPVLGAIPGLANQLSGYNASSPANSNVTPALQAAMQDAINSLNRNR